MSNYIIQRGDTLSQIASKFNVDMHELAEMNGIRDINKIQTGKTLKINQPSFLDTVQETLSSFRKDPEPVQEVPEPVKEVPETAEKVFINPRQRAIQNRSTAKSTPSRGLMAQSQKRSLSEVEEDKKNTFSLLTSTPAKTFLTSLVSSPVLDQNFLKDTEYNILKEISAAKIKRGKTGLTYSDYNKEAGSKIGYKMKMPDVSDPTEALKFTLGKASLVREGNNIIVADEFDFQSGENKSDESIFDKIKFLTDRTGKFLSGDISKYGLAHSLGEVVTPAGEGPYFRIVLGTAEDLGINKKQFNKLPTLEMYTKKNKDRIKQRPLRNFLAQLGIVEDMYV